MASTQSINQFKEHTLGRGLDLDLREDATGFVSFATSRAFAGWLEQKLSEAQDANKELKTILSVGDEAILYAAYKYTLENAHAVVAGLNAAGDEKAKAAYREGVYRVANMLACVLRGGAMERQKARGENLKRQVMSYFEEIKQ